MKNWKDKYENELTKINKQTAKIENEIEKRKTFIRHTLRNNEKISSFLKDIKKSISLINEVNSKSPNRFNIYLYLEENDSGKKYENYGCEINGHIILQSNNKNKKRLVAINLDNPQKPLITIYNCRTEYESTGFKTVYKNEWKFTNEGFEQDYDIESTGSREITNIKKKTKKQLSINELNTELSNSIIGWLLFEENVISANGKTIDANVNFYVFFNIVGEIILGLLYISTIASFITPLIIGLFTGTIHYWNYYIISFISIIIIGLSLYTLIFRNNPKTCGVWIKS